MASSFDLKTTVGYFQTTTEKEPDSIQEKRPLFTADELAVVRLFTLFTSDYSFRVNKS
jgi:hypothetical protein